MINVNRCWQLGVTTMVSAMVGTVAMADLNWLTDLDEAHAILESASPRTPVFSSTNADADGAFLQLIYSPSGIIDPAVYWAISPDGIDHAASDNVVLDTSFFGFGTVGPGDLLNPTLQGLKQINQSVSGSFDTNDYFFVRAWTAPASTPSYVNGEIPTATDAHYWDSNVYQWPAGDAPINTFVFNTHDIPPASPLETYAATLVVIPEPSTVLLLLMALGLVGRRMVATSRG